MFRAVFQRYLCGPCSGFFTKKVVDLFFFILYNALMFRLQCVLLCLVMTVCSALGLPALEPIGLLILPFEPLLADGNVPPEAEQLVRDVLVDSPVFLVRDPAYYDSFKKEVMLRLSGLTGEEEASLPEREDVVCTGKVLEEGGVIRLELTLSSPGREDLFRSWRGFGRREAETWVATAEAWVTGGEDSLAGSLGSLRVSTEPSGAYVCIQSAFVGETPWEGSLQEGSCRVLTVKQGYDPVVEYVNILPGEDHLLHIDLQEADYGSEDYQFDYYRDYFFIPSFYLGTVSHFFFNAWGFYGLLDDLGGVPQNRLGFIYGQGIEATMFSRGFLTGIKAITCLPFRDQVGTVPGHPWLVDVHISPLLNGVVKLGNITLLSALTLHAQLMADRFFTPSEISIMEIQAGVHFSNYFNLPVSPTRAWYIQLDVGAVYGLLRYLNGEQYIQDTEILFPSGYFQITLGRSFY